eukprot:6181312-Pleurochrysis_carterae.AAC.1
MTRPVTAHMRAAAVLIGSNGSPVAPDRAIKGVPRDPNATGDVFARRQAKAACKGSNPSATNMEEDTATGVPNPAAPSRKPLKHTPTRSTSSLRSVVTGAMLAPMASR